MPTGMDAYIFLRFWSLQNIDIIIQDPRIYFNLFPQYGASFFSVYIKIGFEGFFPVLLSANISFSQPMKNAYIINKVRADGRNLVCTLNKKKVFLKLLILQYCYVIRKKFKNILKTITLHFFSCWIMFNSQRLSRIFPKAFLAIFSQSGLPCLLLSCWEKMTNPSSPSCLHAQSRIGIYGLLISS